MMNTSNLLKILFWKLVKYKRFQDLKNPNNSNSNLLSFLISCFPPVLNAERRRDASKVRFIASDVTNKFVLYDVSNMKSRFHLIPFFLNSRKANVLSRCTFRLNRLCTILHGFLHNISSFNRPSEYHCSVVDVYRLVRFRNTHPDKLCLIVL